ncbi:MAG: hypothetical protein ACK55Z_25060, partial [bacterium]
SHCCFEDSFPQRQLHHSLQLRIGERIRRSSSHHGLCRLAVRYVEVAGLPAVLVGAVHAQRGELLQDALCGTCRVP